MADYWSMSQIYIALLIIILAVIAGLSWRFRKTKPPKLSTLAAAAFALIVAGIVFGENRLVGYSLIGIGVGLAVIDMIRNRPKNR